jgi:DNA polymerase III subunit chi
MPEVSFHTNLPDRVGYACRLLRKAVRRGARVVVAGPPPLLAQLDRALWTFDPTDFVPHVHARAGQSLAPRFADTPVWLADSVPDAPHREVLVNLGEDMVEGYAAFSRVIELVSQDGPDVAPARSRWKRYAADGHAPQKFERTEADA